MSALGLASLPPVRPNATPNHRHLDVVSSRRHKRARPKAVYAVITVAGLFAILIAQLLLSIVISDGAYQISSLQQVQKELSRDQQSLSEQLHVLKSPQHLAANAKELGMVTNPGTAYLRLADGAIIGKAIAAHSGGGIRTSADGGPLVANELLAGVEMTPASSVTAASDPTGGPDDLGRAAAISSSDAELPTPVTR